MAEDKDAPIETVTYASRHHWPNGVYILGWDVFADRLVLRLFTSRPVKSRELLGRLKPFDSVGTNFMASPPDSEFIDGRGIIEFRPAPPDRLSRLGLRDALGGNALMPYWRDDAS
jgi:hypothetical protein